MCIKKDKETNSKGWKKIVIKEINLQRRVKHAKDILRTIRKL